MRQRGRVVASFWAVVIMASVVVWPALAGEGFTTTVYEGRITSIRVDKCGLQPGLCEGSIIVASPNGADTMVSVRVGTWIKRGDEFLTIENLSIGDRVKAQTFRFPGEANPRAAILEFTRP